MKSRQTALHRVKPPIKRSVREYRKGLIDLVWMSCVSVGPYNPNNGFLTPVLESNEAISPLGCSFDSMI
jgi:hypothetical protein